MKGTPRQAAKCEASESTKGFPDPVIATVWLLAIFSVRFSRSSRKLALPRFWDEVKCTGFSATVRLSFSCMTLIFVFLTVYESPNTHHLLFSPLTRSVKHSHKNPRKIRREDDVLVSPVITFCVSIWWNWLCTWANNLLRKVKEKIDYEKRLVNNWL